MTINELQIQLDISAGNETEVLKQHAYENSYVYETSYGYVFVDSSNGQCYLFDSLGKIDDISKVKRIGNYAFAYCTSFKSIIIPDSVESIGYGAFGDCPSLESIIIPGLVENIGKWAFGDCPSLKEIIFKGKTMNQVKAIVDYPWGIKDTSIIKCQMS